MVIGQRWEAELPQLVINALTDKSEGCYELHKQTVFATFTQAHTYGYKYIYRITERCQHRIVKRGYHSGNREHGQGIRTDFDRAFQGYESTLSAKVNQSLLF